jgi:hypothetical protein
VEDALAITYTELWLTQDDLEHHLRSPNYLLLLQLIDLSEREPEVRFMATTACWNHETHNQISKSKSQNPKASSDFEFRISIFRVFHLQRN